MKSYFVYILANESRMLYIGVTNDLCRRMYEHKNRLHPGYAAEHSIDRLVYFEETSDILSAIAREKQLKTWKRIRKVDLIRAANPAWSDLSVRLGLVEVGEER